MYVQFAAHSAAVYCDPPPHPRVEADNGGYHDWTSESDLPPYPTLVEYRCHAGRSLVDADGFYHERQTIQCQWDKTWTEVVILPCAWTHCIDPPERDNMEHDYVGEPYDFHSAATYRCRQGFYFEHDRGQQTFAAECLTDGSFAEPDPWPVCVTDVQCAADPPGAPAGGRRRWSGSRDYDTSLTYDCGPHARFYPDLLDSVGTRCQWNKTWDREDLPFCKSQLMSLLLLLLIVLHSPSLRRSYPLPDHPGASRRVRTRLHEEGGGKLRDSDRSTQKQNFKQAYQLHMYVY